MVEFLKQRLFPPIGRYKLVLDYNALVGHSAVEGVVRVWRCGEDGGVVRVEGVVKVTVSKLQGFTIQNLKYLWFEKCCFIDLEIGWL